MILNRCEYVYCMFEWKDPAGIRKAMEEGNMSPCKMSR